MKLPDLSSARGQRRGGSSALRGGSYALAVTAVVLAILVAVNVFAAALPASLTHQDISAAQLYSVTSNTKVVVNNLAEDVTIYWIVQSGEEDDVIQNLLEKYDSLSDHITVEKRNPDVYPTFAQQYTDQEVANNSLVVECGDKSRYIPLTDIYLGEINPYTGGYNATDFDGEGAITSAIDYVTSDEYPQVYLLEGHGEGELPSAFASQIEKENMQVQSLSLLQVDAIPEDAACLLIYAPQSDLSAEEKEMLADYVAGGGRLLVCAGAVEGGMLENLYSLLADHGVAAQDGLVIDPDRAHYALSPYQLMPEMNSSPLTDPLLEENYYAIFPLSIGLTVETDSDAVTELLTTSAQSYSKAAGYALETYDWEEGDAEGPFAVAVSIEEEGGGQIVWFASDQFLADEYNALSSGANLDLAVNALSSLVGESDAMAIRSRSLRYNYLTIDSATASLLQVLRIGVFPLLFLGIGIYVVLRRRRMQHVSL